MDFWECHHRPCDSSSKTTINRTFFRCQTTDRQRRFVESTEPPTLRRSARHIVLPTSCHDGNGTILSGSMRCTRWTWKRYGNSSSFGRYGVPCSSVQPSLAGGNSLRVEKKKQTSRRNLGVKWMVGIAAFAAIASIRRRLSGHATLELIRATLSQRRRRRQLPFE